MHLNSPAMVLDVPDPVASCDLHPDHLGFEVTASGDGFSALGHEDHGLPLIFRPLAPGRAPAEHRPL